MTVATRQKAPYEANNADWVDYLANTHDSLGIPDDVLVFAGPPNWHCCGHRYELLHHDGVREEGALSVPVSTPEEAVEAYRKTFKDYIAGAVQVAWRSCPALEERPGGYIIRSRLFVYRE